MSTTDSPASNAPRSAHQRRDGAHPPLLRWLSEHLGQHDHRVATDDGDGLVGLVGLAIDHFREVNEALGYCAADSLLDDVATRLHGALDGVGVLTTMPGPIFAIAVTEPGDSNALYNLAERLLHTLSAPFDTPRGAISLSASSGVVDRSTIRPDINALMSQLDAAVHAAKLERRGGVLLFDPARHNPTSGLLRLRGHLRHDLAAQRLEVAFQPIVSLDQSRVEGVETLARWRHAEHGAVGPRTFLPLLQPDYLALSLTEQILDQALEHLAHWQDTGVVGEDFYVSVNASAVELTGPLDQLVRDLLDHHRTDPANLMIEVTEAGLMGNAALGTETAGRLRNLGVQLAVDNLGTAFASLDRLLEWPVSCLKLDRSLIDRVVNEPVAAAVVRGMAGIAASLDLALVAEGVEAAPQVEALRELAVPSAQGFLWCPPLDARQATVWLDEYQGVVTPGTQRR